MRLLFISNLYPPLELGGYGQWCQEIADGMRLRGHDVQILTSNYRANELDTWEPNVHRTLHLQADLHHYEPVRFLTRFQEEEADNKAALQRIVSAFRPDLIMVWGMWNLSTTVAHWAELLMPDRVAYFVSSYWPADSDMHSQYWQLPANHMLANLVKRPLRTLAERKLKQANYPPALRFQHVCCCSQYVRDTLVKQGKILASASVLLGGIDATPYKQQFLQKSIQPQHTLRLLYFGRLIADKGVHTIIEALANSALQDLENSVSLTILGNGHPAYEAHLHELVATHDLADRVTFAGQVPQTEIPDWLAQHDVYIFSSIWPEPFGRTILEAMAAGLVVIGADVGGSREIFHHYSNALLYSAGDADELAQRIKLIVNDDKLRSQLIVRGGDLVESHFSMDRSIDDFENWVQTINNTTVCLPKKDLLCVF